MTQMTEFYSPQAKPKFSTSCDSDFLTPTQSDSDDEQSIPSDNSTFHFNSEPKQSFPISRAMKILIDHKSIM